MNMTHYALIEACVKLSPPLIIHGTEVSAHANLSYPLYYADDLPVADVVQKQLEQKLAAFYPEGSIVEVKSTTIYAKTGELVCTK